MVKMAKGIVIYYSRTGNTKEMAEIIAKAMNEADLPTECKSVSDVKAEDVFGYDAIVIGSPTYYGQMAARGAHATGQSRLWTPRFARGTGNTPWRSWRAPDRAFGGAR